MDRNVPDPVAEAERIVAASYRPDRFGVMVGIAAAVLCILFWTAVCVLVAMTA